MPEVFFTKQVISNMKFFSAFSEVDIQKFIQEANVRIYRKNSNIFLRGDKAETLFVVLNGWVKLFKETPEGEDVIVGLVTKGDILSHTTIFGDKLHPYSALALSDVSIAEISLSSIRAAAKNNNEVMENIVSFMAGAINDLHMEIEHLSVMSAPQRVGCLILKLATQVGNKYESYLPYDKSLAAAKLGMKPETFSRALAQLRSVGVTSRGSTIAIESIEKLSTFCCRHCSSIINEAQQSKEACCCNNAVCSKLKA